MAVLLRSRRQIEKMREAGRLVAQTFEHLRPHVLPGRTMRELDRLAEQFIRQHGAIPAYKERGYRGPDRALPGDDLRRPRLERDRPRHGACCAAGSDRPE